MKTCIYKCVFTIVFMRERCVLKTYSLDKNTKNLNLVNCLVGVGVGAGSLP